MKERTIRSIVLSVVFVLAIIVFSYWTNRGNTDMTADMSVATLPTLSFVVAEKDVNYLVGHKREMDFSAVRDTISVYEESNKLEMSIHHSEGKVDSVKYEIFTLGGEKKLHEETIDQAKDKVTLKMGNALKEGQEGVLKITLSLSETDVYYYTRVIQNQEYHIEECISFVEKMHSNILTKQNEDAVKKVMESNSEGDNTTLQHVTIHSSLDHVMWSDLEPVLVNDVQMDIKEAKKAYVSVLLQYQVVCAGDNNEEEHYKVKEFFKVAKGKERVYLLEYDRVMEEVFRTTNVVLSSKGVILGITDKEMPYKVNKDGTVVAFVQADELWNYNRTEDAFSLIFSFSAAEKYDERHDTDNHSIQMLSMEDGGNMTFSVSGYMNRGEHEGESGVAIYYYYADKNCVEEIAFIPSSESYLAMKKRLSESAYYNQKEDMLYLLSGGALRKFDMKESTSSVLVDGLEKGQYVASEDGHLFAYQKSTDGNVITEVWDFSKDSRKEISAPQGEIVVPLGFVQDDFVYGISRLEEKGYDSSGTMVQAMYRVEIRNKDNQTVKTYEQKGVYILRAMVSNNMVTLTQGVKEGNIYKETSEDYITNNETSASAHVELKSYWTDLKQTQYRLAFSDKIGDTKAKTLRPKLVIQERITQLQPEENNTGNYFCVYGHGKLAGVFEESGEAVALAKELSGVVISPEHNYVWEEDNRESWYRNFDVSAFTVQDGETSLAACVRKVLTYEGKSGDASAELSAKSAEQVLGEGLETEAIRFRKCSVKDMFYLIDKGSPVIGLKDSSRAILIIGYDAKSATYIDPTNGGTYSSTIEKVDEMLKGSGNTFIAYVR